MIELPGTERPLVSRSADAGHCSAHVGATEYSDPYPAIGCDGMNFTVLYKRLVGCRSHVGGCRLSRGGSVGQDAVVPGPALVRSVDIAFGETNGLVVMESQHLVYEEIVDETTGESFQRIAGGYPEVLGMFIDRSW